MVRTYPLLSLVIFEVSPGRLQFGGTVLKNRKKCPFHTCKDPKKPLQYLFVVPNLIYSSIYKKGF